MDTVLLDDEQHVVNHVTDLQQPQQVELEALSAEPLTHWAGAPGDSLPDAGAAAVADPGAAVGESGTPTGLETSASKRRRYRSLFGNIGKLITFNRRRQEAPPPPTAAEDSEQQQQQQQLPTAEVVSLDLVVPDPDTLSGDQVPGQVTGLDTLHPPEAPPPAAKAEAGTVEETQETQAAETRKEECEARERSGLEAQPEKQQQLQEQLEELSSCERAEAEEKHKMEFDMSLGGISTILEETEEAVKAQEGGLTEEDLIKLESEIDLADVGSERRVREPALEKAAEPEEEALAKAAEATAAAAKAARDPEGGKAKPASALQKQISESDSGYGYSTSDSPVEAEVEKPEKPQPAHAEEAEGSNGGSDVFNKEAEDSRKPVGKGVALISPSEEELASFEKAEVSVEDSMVDLGDISVKVDSLIEANCPDKPCHSDEPDAKLEMKPELVRMSESLDEENDEEMEPVELDLSSNQSVRRRKILEAKARRQRELEAARRQQEEALHGEPAPEEARAGQESGGPEVRDKDIVDGLGPRRHSHENTACAEGAEGERSRLQSRLPVRRSASCPRRAVEDYSTYIRSGSSARKAIAHLFESTYSPVKIDFKPLSRSGPEAHGEQLAPEQSPTGQAGQGGRRGGKKVHFNSPTVDQVATYAAAAPADGDEMKQRGDCEENGQHTTARARAVARASRQRPGETERGAAGQSDRSLIKAISVKQTLASRKRLEKLHEDAVKQLGLQDESQYMTPLQRKDLEVKELKRQLDEAYFVIEQRELELDVFHHEKAKSIEDAVKDREEKIACLQVQVSQLEADFACLRTQHSEICQREKNLTESLEKLKVECAEREKRHQDLYLEMYKKGRDSAKFERQDEIEKLAVLEPDKVAMEELLEKLEITQHDLQKWQSIKLKEVYEDSDKAGTEADAKLRFLRDSMFHYLIEKDREQNQQHLMAMIGIFSFTDVQMKHIMKSLDERRRKGKL